MSPPYLLQKRVWSETDFEQMGWHDARVWGIAFLQEEFELAIDIDYILEWVEPQPGQTHFEFWVVPATLVFQNAHDVRLDLEPYASLSIDEIKRGETSTPRNASFIGKSVERQWVVACHEGDIELRATGFYQYLRGEPMLTSSQHLPLQARGGISFARPTV